jgi:hypothetical protein
VGQPHPIESRTDVGEERYTGAAIAIFGTGRDAFHLSSQHAVTAQQPHVECIAEVNTRQLGLRSSPRRAACLNRAFARFLASFSFRLLQHYRPQVDVGQVCSREATHGIHVDVTYLDGTSKNDCNSASGSKMDNC